MTGVDDQIAASFSRAVTRRRFLQRAMGATLVFGTSASAAGLFAKSARAGACGVGHVATWGCFCASTQTCPGGNADCAGLRRRCDAWTTFPYCWCSLVCCIGSGRGYYSCCDCWTAGSGGCGCACGGAPCIAKHRHITAIC